MNHQIGYRYKDASSGDEYILASVSRNEICLVNLNLGTRYDEAVEVESFTNITQGEFDLATKGTAARFTCLSVPKDQLQELISQLSSGSILRTILQLVHDELEKKVDKV